MTLVNIVIGSQVSYRAVEHMETVQFCGQSCHAMKPEFTAHQKPPHSQVACVSCHVAPGVTGWLASKTAGTRQLAGVVFNSYPRPIESALESDRLVSSPETCEQCHARERPISQRLRTITRYRDDEANTRTDTVLMMPVGGGKSGGIHGAHMGPGVQIRYAAADKKRQTIPWVEYRNTDTGVTRTYLAGDAKPDATKSASVFEMQCVDCHNRAAHSFELPDRAIDDVISTGEISAQLPFVRKVGLELIKAQQVAFARLGQY
jgi:nitrate/TMAO reductase-like tetraheme cytochrome c subunit